MTTTKGKFGGTKAAIERAEALKAAKAPEPAPAPRPAPAVAPAPGSPEQLLADADAEITEADALLTTLERRVVDGDDDVQPEQIEQARGLRRFAQLRREAAEKKAAKLRQDRADAKRDAALAEARRLLDEHGPEDIKAKAAKLRETVLELHQAVDAFNANALKAFTVMSTGHAVPITTIQPGDSTRPEGLAWGYYAGSRIVWDNGNNVIGAFSSIVDRTIAEAKDQRHREVNGILTAEEIQANRQKLAQADAKLHGTPAWVELNAARQHHALAVLGRQAGA